tara:strand:- start:7273 stop:8250 length:978 start_codon:yes stop_codon:yes gene_type:complete
MIDRKKYREYKLEQTRIQGNINTEFDYFINTDIDVEVIEDEFISNVKISGDYHDMMLKEDIEIAFQSAENELVIIPNYETLEVMLVERGLTYDAIRVQTNIDDFIYNNLYSLDDRSEEYSNVIRFESGYRPAFPFVRDPGDYIDGNDYDEQVYQKQTLTEKLREQFEGRFITLRYSMGGDQGDYQFWNQLKIMIYGEWRSIGYQNDDGGFWASWDILDYYNIVNGFGAEYDKGRRYVQSDSTVATLIEAGGITNLLDNGQSSPVWNDFNHRGFDESPLRLDNGRYERYINTTNNEVFNLEYMQPYEPAGSELYYNEYGGWQQIQY